MLKLNRQASSGAKEQITLTKWLQKHGDNAKGRYQIHSIIPARQGMQDALLLFDTATERVKVRLKPEEWQGFKQEVGIQKAEDIEGKVAYFVVNSANDIGIEAVPYEDDKKIAVYTFDKKKLYWRLEFLDKAEDAIIF